MLATLANSELLRALRQLVAKDRVVEADILTHLGEVDARRLYLAEGCPSMFRFCTDVLHFSEATAFHRIRAARVGRAYPIVLERVRRGEIHLAGITLLAPHLTPENQTQLLDLARHKSKRAIEELLAARAPRPEVRALVRKLPETRTRRFPNSPGRPAQVASAARTKTPAPEPLGERRFKIQFTASQALYEKLRDVQALLRHQIPNGELAEVFDRALTLLRDDARRKKFAETSRPQRQSAMPVKKRGATRHIPAEIKRAVASRDGGRCGFVSRNGRRCDSVDFVEYHHISRWSGSRCHSVAGIELRCRPHNQYAEHQRQPALPGESWS